MTPQEIRNERVEAQEALSRLAGSRLGDDVAILSNAIETLALLRTLSESPEVKPTGESGWMLRNLKDGGFLGGRWWYTREAAEGYRDEKCTPGLWAAIEVCLPGEVKPTGEGCPHLRVGTREGTPWTCRDCGAVRVNGEWSGGSGRKGDK